MNLFYFGSSEQPLFGAYHPPLGAMTKSEGVVLCPPVGVEGLRAQRAFKQLATMLAKSGLHVLRFDYFGTGDSSGECEAASLEQWSIDIETAIEELCDTAGINRIHLVGLRLGGTLAAKLVEKSDKIEKLVLWDPIVDGQAYLEEMINADIDYEPDQGHSAKVDAAVKNQETIGVMGYAVTEKLRDQFKAIDLTQLKKMDVKRSFLLVSSETENYLKLKDKMNTFGKVAYQCIPSPGNWCEFDEFGSLLMPQAMVQGVVACLK